MKLLKIKVINPNSSESMTKKIDAAAKKYKNADTDIVTVSNKYAPPVIDTFADEVIASVGIIKEVEEGLKEGFEGFIIACFNDPAILACRELSPVPVIGIAEAAMLFASPIAYKFSIISMPKQGRAAIEELLKRYSFLERIASIRMVDCSVSEIIDNKRKIKNKLITEMQKAVTEDGAEAIVLGCAGLSGLDKDFEKIIGVPVIDGVVAAVKIIEGLNKYKVKTSKSLTYHFPERKNMY